MTFTDALPHAATTCHRRFDLFSSIVTGPSQNRACAIYAHGSSSVHSPCSEQIHLDPQLRKWVFTQKHTELLPRHAPPLSTSVQPFEEQFSDFVIESANSSRVVRHPIVCKMAPQLCGSPFHQFRGRQHTALLQPIFESKQFGLELLPRGFPLHSKPAAIPRPAAIMRQPQKFECLDLLTSCICFQFSQRPKLQNLGFLGCNFKPELTESSVQFLPKTLCITHSLKADHKVIGIPDQTCPTFTRLNKPSCKPQVKTVVEIDIGQQWRNNPPLCKESNYAKYLVELLINP